MKFLQLILMTTLFGIAQDNYYYQGNEKVFLKPYRTSVSRNLSQIEYYVNENGTLLGVTDKIIVKLKDSASMEKLLKRYSLFADRKIGPNLYVVKTKDKSTTIEIANQLNVNENVVYAQPDFIRKKFQR